MIIEMPWTMAIAGITTLQLKTLVSTGVNTIDIILTTRLVCQSKCYWDIGDMILTVLVIAGLIAAKSEKNRQPIKRGRFLFTDDNSTQ